MNILFPRMNGFTIRDPAAADLDLNGVVSWRVNEQSIYLDVYGLTYFSLLRQSKSFATAKVLSKIYSLGSKKRLWWKSGSNSTTTGALVWWLLEETRVPKVVGSNPRWIVNHIYLLQKLCCCL